MQPTPEQVKAVELFSTGESLVVEAGAGTGKTSTLVLIGESTSRRGLYLAFNRAIVEEAKVRMPRNVTARTAHSLAWNGVIRNSPVHQGRLKARDRVRSDQLARTIGVDPYSFLYGAIPRVLQPGFLASLAMRAIAVFCNSADAVPSVDHVAYVDGIDLPTETGRRTYENNDRVRSIVAGHLPAIWRDLCDPSGRLPFRHDHYLKMFELRDPRVDADFILFDEGQDASPVMRSIVEQQRVGGTQVVYVGDSNQAIYEWRGAVNALAMAEADHRTFLTQSFRFGPAIADAANAVLDVLGAELRLAGTEAIASRVDEVDRPDAVLCRTNAVAVETVLDAQSDGLRPHLLGGGTEIKRFAQGADELQSTGRTNHPELTCFDSWAQVVDYVENDPSGDELSLLVRLVEKYGSGPIITALDRMPSEANADLLVSTAHKAKGREWDTVKIARDFAYPKSAAGDATPLDLSPGELRLMYVAVTRAKLVLDPHDSEPLRDLLGINPPPEGGDRARMVEPTDDGERVHAAAYAKPEREPVEPAAAAQREDGAYPDASREGGAYSDASPRRDVETPAARPWVSPPSSRSVPVTQTAPAAGSVPPAAAATSGPSWWIGRCVTGCNHAAKLFGTKRFDGERFLGFFDADGNRVFLPECKTHHRRPFMKPLMVKPPKPNGKCNASCWNAMSDECTCPCQGANHGSGHAPVATLDAYRQGVAS